MPFEPNNGAVDAILALAALATVVLLVRHWRSFWDDTFTNADRRLAIQLSIFAIPPVVVLLHELGHVAAAVVRGIRVAEFHYGLFEGSVTIVGRITATENWFVALAGNVVSGGVGLAMVAAGVAASSWRRPLRYLLIAGGLYEIVFTLVGYPLLSLGASFGDWEIIYDFERTPVLSWVTAAVHASLLAYLWRWWRRKGRVTLFAIGAGVEKGVADRQNALAANPADEAARLDLARFYLERGQGALARSTLDEGVAAGGSARLHLARARLAVFEQRWNDAVTAARAGLDRAHDRAPDPEVEQRLWANLALALGELARPDHALTAFAHVAPPVSDDPRVSYGRGLARLATGDAAGGRADLEATARSLPEGHLLRQWAEARLHGRVPDAPDESHLPAYARSSAPASAPIAGV